MKKNYDLILIIKGSMKENEALEEYEKILENFKYLTKYNIKGAGFKGKKTLAYNIKEETTGYFYEIIYSTTEERTANIVRNLRINDNIIKFINVKINEKELKEYIKHGI